MLDGSLGYSSHPDQQRRDTMSEKKELYEQFTNPYIFEYLKLRECDTREDIYKFFLLVNDYPIGYIIYEKRHRDFSAVLDVTFQPLDKRLPKVTILGNYSFDEDLKKFWTRLYGFVTKEEDRRRDMSYKKLEDAMSNMEFEKPKEEWQEENEKDLPF